MPANTQNHSGCLRDQSPKHESQSTCPPNFGWCSPAAATVPLMMVGCLVASWLMLASWTKTRPLDAGIRVRGTVVANGIEPLTRFPKPNLELNAQADLAAVRSRENAELASYGWVDRKAGVVRIPIDRAIDLLAQRGLPFRTTNAPIAVGPSEFELSRARSQSQRP